MELIPEGEENNIIIFKNHSNRVEEIILNNPNKLNSLTYEMSQIIYTRIKNYIDIKYKNQNHSFFINETNTIIDKHIIPKMVILSGIGGKSFCSGGSLINLYEYKQNKDFTSLISFYDYELLCDYFFYRTTPLLISIWEGYVMGGGVGISINSVIKIATDNTVFSMPETSIGYFPDVGAAFFLTRIFNMEPGIGLYCGLIGHRLLGRDCVKAGAATHFVKKEDLDKVRQILVEYALNTADDVISVEDLKKRIAPYCELVYSPENFYFQDSHLIKKIFLFDSLESIFSRLVHIVNAECAGVYEKEWARETLSKLNRMSPQALLIFFEYAKRALDCKDITEVYEYDRKLFGKFIYDREFFEGIRAVVIDKDKNPKWNHSSFKDIGNVDEIIGQYFD